MMRKPSCLISCSQWLPDGNLSVLVGRHGAMNPAGRVRIRNIMPIARDYSRAFNLFYCASHASFSSDRHALSDLGMSPFPSMPNWHAATERRVAPGPDSCTAANDERGLQ